MVGDDAAEETIYNQDSSLATIVLSSLDDFSYCKEKDSSDKKGDRSHQNGSFSGKENANSVEQDMSSSGKEIKSSEQGRLSHGMEKSGSEHTISESSRGKFKLLWAEYCILV